MPDDPRTGAESRALEDVVSGCCRGRAVPPTAKELYEAFRSEEPKPRELALLETWFTEATVGQLTQARVQRAYTDRQLARAIHAIGFGRYRGAVGSAPHPHHQQLGNLLVDRPA